METSKISVNKKFDEICPLSKNKISYDKKCLKLKFFFQHSKRKTFLKIKIKFYSDKISSILYRKSIQSFNVLPLKIRKLNSKSNETLYFSFILKLFHIIIFLSR